MRYLALLKNREEFANWLTKKFMFHYSWFAMTSSKIKINEIFDIIFIQRKQSGFDRFLQVSGRYSNKNIRVTAVQSLKNLYIPVHLYYGSHVGRQKNAYQPIFPYNITEHFPTSVAHKSVFIGSNNFKFGTETRCMV